MGLLRHVCQCYHHLWYPSCQSLHQDCCWQTERKVSAQILMHPLFPCMYYTTSNWPISATTCYRDVTITEELTSQSESKHRCSPFIGDNLLFTCCCCCCSRPDRQCWKPRWLGVAIGPQAFWICFRHYLLKLVYASTGSNGGDWRLQLSTVSMNRFWSGGRMQKFPLKG